MIVIITKSASKPPGGPESCGVELTKTVFEKNVQGIIYLQIRIPMASNMSFRIIICFLCML